jgi:hypothetical protein
MLIETTPIAKALRELQPIELQLANLSLGTLGTELTAPYREADLFGGID